MNKKRPLFCNYNVRRKEEKLKISHVVNQTFMSTYDVHEIVNYLDKVILVDDEQAHTHVQYSYTAEFSTQILSKCEFFS